MNEMKKKILLIDSVHDIIPNKLSEYGFEVVNGVSLSLIEILDCIADFCGIVIRSRIIIDKALIDKALNLRFVARVGSGMESIDTEYCKSKGIVCLNSPEGNRDAVGEHCIGMLLSLMNNLNKADREVKSGVWNREGNRGMELNSKTVGIIGYGNMGSSFAKKLSGFSCKVISYDKYKSDYADEYTTEVQMDEIFRGADIVSFHIPLSYETKLLVNEDYISKFKKPIILINTSRGPIVDTKALVKALKSGKVRGAALDVIEYEESSFEKTNNMTKHEDFRYLAQSENLIMSPHIAGWTVESKIKLAEVLVSKIIALKI